MWSEAEHARVSLEARNSIADVLNIEKKKKGASESIDPSNLFTSLI